jgi:hypothetical protein
MTLHRLTSAMCALIYALSGTRHVRVRGAVNGNFMAVRRVCFVGRKSDGDQGVRGVLKVQGSGL